MRSEHRFSASGSQASSARADDFDVTRGVLTSNGPERAFVSPAARSGFVRVRLGVGAGRLGWTIHVPRTGDDS